MSSDHPNDPGHGDSVAAWSAVVVILLAVAGATLALWFEQIALVYVSAFLAVLGVVLGVVLSKLGYGIKSK